MEKVDCRVTFKSAHISITPTFSVPLAGYGFRCQNYTEVSDELEVNCVMIKHNDEVFAFISADLLYVTDQVKAIFSKHIKIQDSHIFFGASHTHFAPNIDFTKDLLGVVNKKYVSYVGQQIKFLADILNKKEFETGHIHYQSDPINLTVHRRKKAWFFSKKILLRFGMFMHPNFDKKVDQNCHAIILKDCKGNHKSIIWCYPCHPVQFPYLNNVSSEFPGRARDFLRQHFESNLSVVYFQGFSGDVRPTIFDQRKTLKKQLLRFLNSSNAIFGQNNKEDYNIWVDKLNQQLLSLIKRKTKCLKPFFKEKSAKISLKKLMKNTSEKSPYVMVKRFHISENLSFFGMNAEVVSDYTNILDRTFSENQIPVGCLENTFGYLPTSKMIKEGGYESKGFIKLFGLKGYFRPNTENIIEQLFYKVK